VSPGGIITDWALSTEGGGMLELFEYEARRGREIAEEHGTASELPVIPVLQPDEVAAKIVDVIEHPVPDLFTHEGTHELAVDFERDQLATEKRLEPLWLANREGYLKLKSNS
jgi:hypothetical protein